MIYSARGFSRYATPAALHDGDPARRAQASDARYFAGFVGWQPGELAAEIKSGWWLVSDPDAALVFSKDTGDELWGVLLKRFGKRPELPAGMRGA